VDLGIAYHDDLSLVPLDLSELALVEQEKETAELVENSFAYKKQVEAVAIAEYNREQVYEEKTPKSKNASSYEKEEADLNVQLEKETLAQLKLDLEEKIRTLYFDIADGYQ